MTRLKYYIINAFTQGTFKGNPACVIPLEDWLSDAEMQEIAIKMRLAETAFFTPSKSGFKLRWFTPDLEIDLCGHATLAAAHCIHAHIGHTDQEIYFETISGPLRVLCHGDEYRLDFPVRTGEPSELPKSIAEALNIKPKEVFKSRDYLLVYETQSEIEQITIDRIIFDQINLGTGGVIVTAPGNDCDFVSRFFTPQATILEDPVTGSAHCTLTPYWSNRLGKIKMNAVQCSPRGGALTCALNGDRVHISGKAITEKQDKL